MVNEQISHIQILFQPLFLYVRGRVFCMVMVRGTGYPFFAHLCIIGFGARVLYGEKTQRKTHSTGLFEWVKSKKNVKTALPILLLKTLNCRFRRCNEMVLRYNPH